MTGNTIPFGPVLIVAGKHKGKIGIYDDDEYNEDTESEEALVYFASHEEGYHVIPMGSVEKATRQAMDTRAEFLKIKIGSTKSLATRMKLTVELGYVEAMIDTLVNPDLDLD